MGNNNSSKKLNQFICYIIGYKPDEFGLVPDSDGYIKIKDLLKALSEEDGWKYVRRHDLDEIFNSTKYPGFEIKEEMIRATSFDNLPKQIIIKNPPKLLYTCVRKKAYPHVLKKGITPMGNSKIILSNQQNLSERIGKRKDPDPVMLTINSSQSIEKGVTFYQFGDLIYLAEFIPIGCFSGPPLQKIKTEPKHEERISANDVSNILPGSFILDPDFSPYPAKGRKKIAWKEDRKRTKRKNNKEWPFIK